ncbi:MAG: hypothetical protein DRP18_03635 [Candidatus Aenigmatarchaeota archaeon]|nr:MAG: hypothetical protein DRP18_03635 [Candidatus Aenigmarchaeota archaeon]
MVSKERGKGMKVKDLRLYFRNGDSYFAGDVYVKFVDDAIVFSDHEGFKFFLFYALYSKLAKITWIEQETGEEETVDFMEGMVERLGKIIRKK